MRLWRLDLKRGRERGQPFGEENNFYYVEGVPPPPLFIGGGEGEPPLEEGAALGAAPLGSPPRVAPRGEGGSFLEAPPRRLPLMGSLGPSAPSPLGPSK